MPSKRGLYARTMHSSVPLVLLLVSLTAVTQGAGRDSRLLADGLNNVPVISRADMLHPGSYMETFKQALRLTQSGHQGWTQTSQAGEAETYRQLKQLKDALGSPFFGDGLAQAAKQLTAELTQTDENSDDLGRVASAETCYADIEAMIGAAELMQGWALEMVDAWGKPGAGLTHPNPAFLGLFDQCLDTKVEGVKFKPQYCSQYAGVQKIGAVSFPQPITFILGSCIPSTCTADNLKDIINVYLYTKNVTGGVGGGKCYDPDLPLSDKATAVIVVCSIFAFLMAAATLYDILVIHGHWQVLFESRDRYNSMWLGESTASDYAKDGGADPAHREFEPLLNNQVKREEYEPNTLEKTLLSFSVYTNGKKVLSTKTGPGSIDCIHGIRFLSMSWVVLGHCFVMGMSVMEHATGYIREAYTRWTFQAIMNALVSVDTFFTLSGLLMTYLVLKELTKKPPTAGFFFNFYFHRFWRLTPPYMLVMMVYITLLHYTGEGPVWPQESFEKGECESNWWANFLYINNLHNFGGKPMCMGWSWYLANDMQFYIISPAIFLIMFYYGWAGLILPFLMIIGSAISAGALSSHYDLQPNMDLLRPSQGDYFDVYYVKPYCRIGPYLVGMMTGYLLYRTDCKATLSKTAVVVGWAVASAIGLAVVYGLFENTNGHPVDTEVAALYNALNRIAWGVAVCWVIFACANGYGGFVNTLLSWKALIPLSRLTYCAYLVHILVLYTFFLSQRHFFYLDNTNIAYVFVGGLVISMMAAFVASMAFEAPFMNLEKILMKGFKALGRCVRGGRDNEMFR